MTLDEVLEHNSAPAWSSPLPAELRDLTGKDHIQVGGEVDDEGPDVGRGPGGLLVDVADLGVVHEHADAGEDERGVRGRGLVGGGGEFRVEEDVAAEKRRVEDLDAKDVLAGAEEVGLVDGVGEERHGLGNRRRRVVSEGVAVERTIAGTRIVSGDLLFGLAPLHALGIGFFSGMILAMASRVTLGHSGRPLELDRAIWLLFLGFQATAVIRIVADLVPAMAAVFYLLAALVWLGCFGMWAFRFAPIYWRARVDGKPG